MPGAGNPERQSAHLASGLEPLYLPADRYRADRRTWAREPNHPGRRTMTFDFLIYRQYSELSLLNPADSFSFLPHALSHSSVPQEDPAIPMLLALLPMTLISFAIWKMVYSESLIAIISQQQTTSFLSSTYCPSYFRPSGHR